MSTVDKPRWQRFINRISVTLGMVSGFGTLALVLLNTQEVIRRYAFHSPTDWAFDVTNYLLIFIAYMGMAYCLMDKGHVMVDMVYQALPRRVQQYLDSIDSVLALLVWGVLVWQSINLNMTFVKTGQSSGTLFDVPYVYVGVLITIGCLAICLEAIAQIYESFIALRAGKSKRDAPGPARA